MENGYFKLHMETQKLALFGAGGMAREVADLILPAINEKTPVYDFIAYVVDDKYYEEGKKIRGIPIRNRQWLIDNRETVVCCCAIGYPKAREQIQKNLMAEGVRFVNLIHPSSEYSDTAQIGVGCIFYSHVGVSVDCRLGDGVFLSKYASVGHDTILGDYVTCFPKSQISGRAVIGEAACIGSLSFIQEKVKVGAEAVIAPGSMVFTNVKPKTYVLGNPAKRIAL